MEKLKALSICEIEEISGGKVNAGEVAMAGLSGGAAYGAIGAGFGAFAGPAGGLVGGMVGFGFGVIGGVYTYMS